MTNYKTILYIIRVVTLVVGGLAIFDVMEKTTALIIMVILFAIALPIQIKENKENSMK